MKGVSIFGKKSRRRDRKRKVSSPLEKSRDDDPPSKLCRSECKQEPVTAVSFSNFHSQKQIASFSDQRAISDENPWFATLLFRWTNSLVPTLWTLENVKTASGDLLFKNYSKCWPVKLKVFKRDDNKEFRLFKASQWESLFSTILSDWVMSFSLQAETLAVTKICRT